MRISQAQALFRSLGIKCRVDVFQSGRGTNAYESLLVFVEQYFSAPTSIPPAENDPKIQNTRHPPIYLQCPGHSMTIIGLEIRTNGSRNLLVFDPAYQPSIGMKYLLSENLEIPKPGWILGRYRPGARQLRKLEGFEALRLFGPTPVAA